MPEQKEHDAAVLSSVLRMHVRYAELALTLLRNQSDQLQRQQQQLLALQADLEERLNMSQVFLERQRAAISELLSEHYPDIKLPDASEEETSSGEPTQTG